jgi:acyl-homoserine-lactone acylase
VLNPPNGWAFNSNNWPYGAAGPYSPKKADYPKYMDRPARTRAASMPAGAEGPQDFTLGGLITAAYDPYLTAFARLVPTLVAAYAPHLTAIRPRPRSPIRSRR